MGRENKMFLMFFLSFLEVLYAFSSILELETVLFAFELVCKIRNDKFFILGFHFGYERSDFFLISAWKSGKFEVAEYLALEIQDWKHSTLEIWNQKKNKHSNQPFFFCKFAPGLGKLKPLKIQD
ncbi:hypothetical protein C1645_745248 [Glomus cerebriforme]|uniref:Uncharacterized protein n=1 Tax=Glomus cerebriforme TaxID=658196 RepID=A0A397S8W8_9GLOM|nr:hypothetical protein C1645_745248 [Glomus cerebriforme]